MFIFEVGSYEWPKLILFPWTCWWEGLPRQREGGPVERQTTSHQTQVPKHGRKRKAQTHANKDRQVWGSKWTISLQLCVVLRIWNDLHGKDSTPFLICDLQFISDHSSYFFGRRLWFLTKELLHLTCRPLAVGQIWGSNCRGALWQSGWLAKHVGGPFGLSGAPWFSEAAMGIQPNPLFSMVFSGVTFGDGLWVLWFHIFFLMLFTV